MTDRPGEVAGANATPGEQKADTHLETAGYGDAEAKPRTPDASSENNNKYLNNSSQPQSPRTPLLDDLTNNFIKRAASRRISQDYDRHVGADDNDQQNFHSSTGSDAVGSSTHRGNSSPPVRQHHCSYQRENSGNQTPLSDSNQFFASAARRRYSNDWDRHVVANDNNQKNFTNAYSPSEVHETETRRRLSVSDAAGGSGDVGQQQPARAGDGGGSRPRYVQQLSKKSEVPSDYERTTAGPTSTDESDYDERMPRQQTNNNKSVFSHYYQNEQQQQNDDKSQKKPSRRPQSSGSGGRQSRERDVNAGGGSFGSSWFGSKPLQDQNLEELIFTALRLLLLLTCLFISLKLATAIGRHAWRSYHHTPTVSRLQRGIQVEKGEYCRNFDKQPNYGFPVAMEEMLHDARWSDVVVEANDGTQKKAHKVVLAARSPVLRAKLEALSKQTDDDGHVSCSTDKPCKLRLEQVDGEVLSSFIEFLYTSRTSDRKHAAELLGLGHAFHVPDLKDAAAEDLMLNMSDDHSVHGLIAGHDHEHSGLRNFSMEYIRENWKHIRESDAWKHAIEHRPSLIIDALMYVITESKCRF